METSAINIHKPPIVKYALPRKGFFPPRKLVVVNTRLLLPLKEYVL